MSSVNVDINVSEKRMHLINKALWAKEYGKYYKFIVANSSDLLLNLLNVTYSCIYTVNY